MGQHLGFNGNGNVLRRQLEKRGFRPEECCFRLVAHGPLAEESPTKDEHRVSRDVVAALEKALAEAMCDAGYMVINTVACRKPLDTERLWDVIEAFLPHFPSLQRPSRESCRA